MLFIRGMVDTFSISELQKSRLMLHKTNNECFSFVRWYSYFHSVKGKTQNHALYKAVRSLGCSVFIYLS